MRTYNDNWQQLYQLSVKSYEVNESNEVKSNVTTNKTTSLQAKVVS